MEPLPGELKVEHSPRSDLTCAAARFRGRSAVAYIRIRVRRRQAGGSRDGNVGMAGEKRVVACGGITASGAVNSRGGVNLDAGQEAAERRLHHDGGGSMKHRGLGEATSNLARNHPM